MAASERQPIFLATPLTFNRATALIYTGISVKLFAWLERDGQLTGRRIGRNGEKIYLREQLDTVTAKLFGASRTDIDVEFEGISD